MLRILLGFSLYLDKCLDKLGVALLSNAVSYSYVVERGLKDMSPT